LRSGQVLPYGKDTGGACSLLSFRIVPAKALAYCAAQLIQFIRTGLRGQTFGAQSASNRERPAASRLHLGRGDHAPRPVRYPAEDRLPARSSPSTAPPIRNSGTSEPTSAAISRRFASHPWAGCPGPGFPWTGFVRGVEVPILDLGGTKSVFQSPVSRAPHPRRVLAFAARWEASASIPYPALFPDPPAQPPRWRPRASPPWTGNRFSI